MITGVNKVVNTNFAHITVFFCCAGLDVNQMYEIVNGAAGSSWMFTDRGKRMIDNPDDKVMSALAIFVKDMDIVYNEAKRLQCPIPLATTALQQFISGSSLGLSKEDDSQVVKVYETLTGVSVSESKKSTQGGDDVWAVSYTHLTLPTICSV